MGPYLFPSDVTDAYLKSSEPFKRDVFVKPCRKFSIDSHTLLKCKKPLYDLAESGDYRERTLKMHLTDELSMNSCTLDTAVYY